MSKTTQKSELSMGNEALEGLAKKLSEAQRRILTHTPAMMPASGVWIASQAGVTRQAVAKLAQGGILQRCFALRINDPLEYRLSPLGSALLALIENDHD